MKNEVSTSPKQEFVRPTLQNPASRMATRACLQMRQFFPIGLFIVQWVFLLRFSWMQYSHFALTEDFSIYHQAWYQIAHGHLNPREFINGAPYYKNHLELIMWALAPLYWLWPHSYWLLALQDTGIAGSGYVAWLWITSFIQKSQLPSRYQALVKGMGLFLLLGNPWVIKAATFDFHFQDVATLFLILAAWQFYNRKNHWGIFLAVLVFLTGNVSMTYLAALGLSLLIVDRGRHWRGWVVMAMGAGGFLLSEHLGVNLGASVVSATSTSHPSLTSRSLLLNLLLHPLSIFVKLWENRINMYANMAPDGIIGVLNVWTFPIIGLVMVENALTGSSLFTIPGFQSFPMYSFMAIGTSTTVSLALRHRRWIGLLLGTVIIANAAGWFVVWTPTMIPQAFIDHVTTSGGEALSWVRHHISPNAEIVGSQGIIGRFAGRSDVLPLMGGSTVPLVAHKVVFVLSPYQGTNISSVSDELNRVQFLSHLHGAHLMIHKAGIWAFSWSPPPRLKSIVFPSAGVTPAWGLSTSVGTPIIQGPIQSWHMTTKSDSYGYVVKQADWRLPNGNYTINVRISETGPSNLEVWNATANVLLRRFAMPQTNGIENVAFRFAIRRQYPLNLFRGQGPFQLSPETGRNPNDNIELRVWTPGHEIINVYQLQIRKVKKIP